MFSSFPDSSCLSTPSHPLIFPLCVHKLLIVNCHESPIEISLMREINEVLVDYLNAYFHTYRSRRGLLNLGTIDMLRRMILCCRDSSVHFRMFSRIFGLHPPNTNSICPVSTTKMSPDIVNCPLGWQNPPS